MRHIRTKALSSDWKVLGGTRRSQAAMMIIAPGDSEGGPGNKHDGDQWLYVVSGRGVAKIGKKRVPLRPGDLLLVEKGEEHEIDATGRTPLRTLNFYAPPHYTKSGDER